MVEIPEAEILSNQLREAIIGLQVKNVIANNSPHKFAWFHGEPSEYPDRLIGKTVDKINTKASYIEICLGNTKILLAEGISMRYFLKGEKLPKKHQLLIEFENDTTLTVSIRMYGGIWCYDNDEFQNTYFNRSEVVPSPLTDEFDYEYFKGLIGDDILNKSIKAFLATEQRIPGLGNGVLQDILFNARLHPKTKMSNLTDDDLKTLFDCIKHTLLEMVMQGGRDVEKDLFGCAGGYKTKLSQKTYKEPCKICGADIVKKAYMGGSIYYCEGCQVEV